MKILFLSFFVFIFVSSATAQDTVKKYTPPASYKPNAINTNFPFIVGTNAVEYDITVNLNDQKIIDKYSTVFKISKVPFTSESWEELISGLFDEDSEMHHQIITSPQPGVLRIGTGGLEYQKAFLKYMLPIINDMDKLDAFLKKGE